MNKKWCKTICNLRNIEDNICNFIVINVPAKEQQSDTRTFAGTMMTKYMSCLDIGLTFKKALI